MATTAQTLLQRLEDAATECMTQAHAAGKVAHLPGIHIGAVKAAGELAQAIVALRQHLRKRPGPACDDWQPIATAPRDGTPFLAYRDGIDLIEQCEVIVREDGEIWRCGIRSWHASVFPERVPTHWMPRPSNP